MAAACSWRRDTQADVGSGRVRATAPLLVRDAADALLAGMWMTHRRGVKDPVCGMTVDRTKALRATHDDRTVYFCSDGCRTRFMNEPQTVDHNALSHHH